MSTDTEIVRRSLADPQVFAELFDRHAVSLHSYASRRAGRSVADDVMSETFLVAFERRRTFDLGVESARPWLFGIAGNLLARHSRQQERQWRAYARHARFSHDALDADESEVVGRVDAATSKAALALALGTLGEMDREVVLLFAWADLSYGEIAEALGIPLGTVRSKLHRARQSLREALAASGHTLTGEASHG